jgi:hypothetical protein
MGWEFVVGVQVDVGQGCVACMLDQTEAPTSIPDEASQSLAELWEAPALLHLRPLRLPPASPQLHVGQTMHALI